MTLKSLTRLNFIQQDAVKVVISFEQPSDVLTAARAHSKTPKIAGKPTICGDGGPFNRATQRFPVTGKVVRETMGIAKDVFV